MKIRKILVTVMAVIMVLGLFSSIASASNNVDEYFAFQVNANGYTTTTNVRSKTDTSPLYLLFYTIQNHNSAYVRTVAGANGTNLTQDPQGYMLNHVTCSVGVQYSIHSTIYESGYSTAQLAFASRNYLNSEYMTGVWSPDSVGRYVDATMW